MVIFAAICLAALLAPSPPVGDGVVNSDGTIDIRLNVRFPPTSSDLNDIRSQVTVASQVLWDATEGQMRFGDVQIDCGSVNEDLADLWVFAESGRAGVSFNCNGSGLGVNGRHVSLFLPSSDGTVVAHEFGHLALGLGDEYDEQSRFGACWGYGPCFDSGATAQSHCLMQQNQDSSELCTAAAHDPLTGEGTPCTTGAAPCTDNCDLFNPTTGRYETTQQERVCVDDCWTHITDNFSFLTAPTGLPAAAPPGGFVAPNFIDNCAATDTVLLVLDRSGSMKWNTANDAGEVCGNGVDDDGDGDIDESDDCTESRLAFVQAAARAWLSLAEGQGVRGGVVSFNQLATLDEPFQDVTSGNMGALTGAVDALVAGGNTAIGRALSSTNLLFSAESGTTKTAFLISDGVNTEGETPQSVVPTLQAQGIRVFAISTGTASDDSTLSEISGATGGELVDSRDTSQLVGAFVQQWANYRNEGILVPRMPFSVNARGDGQAEKPVRADDWLSGISPDGASATPSWDFQTLLEAGTTVASIVLAGDLGDMSTFGVEAALQGPAGPNPSSFDSTAPAPGLRVVRDAYFLLLQVTSPNTGTWTVSVRARTGAAPVQTGNMTIVAQNPLTDLFLDVDRRVVTSATQPVQVTATPIYFTPLVGYDTLEASVRLPDDSVTALTLAPSLTDGPAGTVAPLPFRGSYEVRALLRTGAGGLNDPGEAIFAPAPSSAVPVPALERTATESFFVTSGPFPCHSGDPADCDGDGVRNESETDDSDGDRIPDAYDTDSDNDEVPDAIEHRDPVQDPDDDGIPNPQDPDSDGDGIGDGVDPTRLGDTAPDPGAKADCPAWFVLFLVVLVLVLIGLIVRTRRPVLRWVAILLLLVVLYLLMRCLP